MTLLMSMLKHLSLVVVTNVACIRHIVLGLQACIELDKCTNNFTKVVKIIVMVIIVECAIFSILLSSKFNIASEICYVCVNLFYMPDI